MLLPPILEDQILKLPKNERKDFLKEKLDFYRSGPDGCISYINDIIRYPSGTTGEYAQIDLWDIQKRMIWEIADFLFDMDRSFYIILGSRQCSKTFSLNVLSDYLLTLFKNYSIVLLHADAPRAALNLSEFKTMYNNKCPIVKYKPTTNRSMKFALQNNSKFVVIPTQKSSKKADTGRSLTANLLWIDEAAFVNLEKLESSVFPVTSQAFIQCRKNNIPHGILLTSSANGRVGLGKRFYDFWKKAEENSIDGIVSRGTISGFKLHYSMVPGKDKTWADNLKEIISERTFNQEYDCVFYGGESTFFKDETIKEIQERLLKLTNTVYGSARFVSTTGQIFDITKFKEIESGGMYICGIDVGKGLNQDYHVLQIFDYNTNEQIIEVKNNSATVMDFAELIDYVTKNIIFSNSGKIIFSIENNLGYSLISDLFTIDDMYKVLIYKDTICEDYKSKKDTSLVEYSQCKYGIATTSKTRPMIIDLIYQFGVHNLDNVFSMYLLNEIESLEMKDGKIQGANHDDAVFALGMLLLMKDKGRVSNIYSIFDACEDFWIDTKNPNRKSERKFSIEVSENTNLDNPISGIGIDQALAMMATVRIPTSLNINSVGNNLSAESIQGISQMYTEKLSELKNLSNNETSSNPSVMGNYSTRKNTFEKMPSSNSEPTAIEMEERYSKGWGNCIADD